MVQIPLEQYNSMKWVKNTGTSYGYGGDNSPHIFARNGTLFGAHKTSNNTWVSSLEHGNFSPQIDDGVRRGASQFPSFDGWKAAGEKYGPAYFNFIKLPTQTSAFGVMESFGERRAEFVGQTPLPKRVHDIEVLNIRNNRLGYYLHHIENSRQRVTKYFGTRIAQLIADEEIKSGKPVEDINWLGVGFLPEGALYGVDRIKDSGILLTVAENAFGRIAREARAFGIDIESYIETILAEEHGHVAMGDIDKDGDYTVIEIPTKSLVYRKLLELAKGAEGGDPRNPKYERERRRRQIQAKIKKYDIETTPSPQRYGKRAFYKELYSKNRAALEEILASEAVDSGYRGKEIVAYVESRLYEIGEEAEENKPKAESRLEKIVDKDDKGPRESGTNREESPQEAATPEAAIAEAN